jgi:ribosomal protein S18 acetylase RimI-like enzyme
MSSHKLRIEAAGADDLAALPFWYDLAGVEYADRTEEVDQFGEALAGGYLSAAVGNPNRGNLRAMTQLKSSQWYHARMSVRVLKLDGESAGMLVMGAHGRLWAMLHERMAEEPPVGPDELSPAEQNFFVTAVSMAKIHVVAVRPDQQGRGHGRRLLREAVRIGKLDELTMLYGMFDSGRAQLGKFYGDCGFRVLAPGEPLTLFPATGKATDVMVPRPHETYFWVNPRRQ